MTSKATFVYFKSGIKSTRLYGTQLTVVELAEELFQKTSKFNSIQITGKQILPHLNDEQL